MIITRTPERHKTRGGRVVAIWRWRFLGVPFRKTARESRSSAVDDSMVVPKPTEQPRPFSCCGKEVARNGAHYADAIDDAAAFHIAMSLNRLHRELGR